MGLLDLIGRKRARDKPQNSYEGQDFFYLFGRTTSGENVDEFKGIKVEFIQLSNKNIFDVLEKDLSKKLRFEDISIEAILGKYLCNNDIEIIKYLYEKDKINMELLISLISKISNKLVKQEFIKVLVLYEYVKNFLPADCIYFSLSNLYGTGHYSSMNYKIFIRTKSGDIFDIADGGRIDDMVSKFNKVNVLGVCMGIGTTVLSQEIEYEIEDRIMILVEKIDVKIYKNYLELANKLSGYQSFFNMNYIRDIIILLFD
ncbi:TPA: portal protein [Streptococcus pyogenes]|nr:portal protein [Streptococcus pyogenes]EIK42390.1 hypothetical protein SPYOHK_07260 [Streptococcus pyogenes HKU QMH11M0907901]EZK64092.1 hypothetical protein Z485_00184 [Streptococcus pyogenes ABC020048184]EZK76675.1 hypothetical protein Z458_00188 [Streptococcus pyogenes ABC020032183]EZK77959.1 hypothetical protein Z456_00187 [Streptococcus pyogenes ABC020031898]EZK80893.1 hypothetical protein Z449_00437 [Streptococcus pyogenes ABC020026946]EZK89527.1 hypothetical protein Z427_00180 [Stre